MDPLILGLLAAVVLIVLLLPGMPVAFALGFTAIAFLMIHDGVGAFDVVAETLFAALDEFTLLSIPMFLLMGSAIAASRAGSDLYEALDRWLYRVPGGLLISNIGACGLFAALTGSSPATCAAIGKMGIPEMRQRGYPPGLATGAIAAGGTLGILIPPSITMIVYGIATETSIGRLFMAGLIPGLMLMLLFMGWSWFYAYSKGFSFTEDDKVFPAIKAGAAGYQLKDVSPSDLVDAIRAAHRGETHLHPDIAKKLMAEVAAREDKSEPDLDELTQRELDVLRLIARGLSNQEIAKELTISEKTVKSHVSSILSKLHVDDRTQAAIYALKRGLGPED